MKSRLQAPPISTPEPAACGVTGWIWLSRTTIRPAAAAQPSGPCRTRATTEAAPSIGGR
jgi:hypothetical protein